MGLSLLAIGIVFVVQIIAVIVCTTLGADAELIGTLIAAVAAAVGVVLLGGGGLLVPDGSALLVALRKGWWVIAVSGVLMVLQIVSYVQEGSSLTDGWPLAAVRMLVECLGIGVLEECTFRGMLLGGTLDAFGRTRRGIVVSMVVGSALFGMAHVVGSVDFGDPLSVVQGILKTMQTGTYGFFLAALTARTRNIVGASLLHGLDDFLLMVATVCVGKPVSTAYVSSGAEAVPAIILYVVVTLLYLPLVWQGVRLLGEIRVPERGAFHREGEGSAVSPATMR